MASLDLIIDRVCEEAGADFAFVLTRRGRLVTRNAPVDMPEAGRGVLVDVAEELLARGGEMAHRELPRQSLVPFGGAAPIYVYVAAREQAILCVVMATYAPQDGVADAMAGGVASLDELIDSEGQRRLRRRGIKAKPPKPKSSTGSSRGAGKGAGSLDFEDAEPADGDRGPVPFMVPYKPPKRATERPPPELTFAEYKAGRATLAAIQIDADGPEITYGMAPVGRHTIAEIELSLVPAGDPRSSVPEISVELESSPEIDVAELDLVDRQTLPFTETADAMKRSFEAAGARGPVTVSSTVQRTVIVGRSAPSRSSRSSFSNESRVPPSAPGVKVQPIEQPPPEPDGEQTLRDMPVPSRLAGLAALAAPRPRTRPPRPRGSNEPPASTASASSGDAGAAPPGQGIPKAGRDSNIEAWHEALGEIALDVAAQAADTAEDEAPKPRTRAASAFPKRLKTLAPPPPDLRARTSRPPKPRV